MQQPQGFQGKNKLYRSEKENNFSWSLEKKVPINLVLQITNCFLLLCKSTQVFLVYKSVIFNNFLFPDFSISVIFNAIIDR